MTEQKKKRSSALQRGLTAVIVLAVVFALLIVGYFAILRPYLNKGQSDTSTPVEMLWAHEVASINNRMLIYEHIPREEIARIDVHNPKNAKYGDQYVDWGFYRYTGEDDEDTGMENGSFYLNDYEYAPFDDTLFAYMVTSAGYTLATSRVEDHCGDYSKYGLDYQTPEEALSVTITATDGRSYTLYIGDQLPSGSGYYVRCINTDTLLSTGEEMQRDSVYVLASTNLTQSVLSTPQKMVDPYLTLPVNTSATDLVDDFAIWRNEEKYFTTTSDENGKEVVRWNPMIRLKPITNKKDPFSLFSGMSVFYAVTPAGYFGSTDFENLISVFGEFKGSEVMELGQTMVSEDGESYIGFSDETFEKYDLLDNYYILYYKYSGVENYVYFSKKQEDGCYYAYSVNFNIIAKVTEETVYFLNWTPETFLQRQIVYLKIDDCESISMEGSYFDLGINNPDRKGEQQIKEVFHLTNTSTNLQITTDDGNVIDTTNFRQFYKQLLMGSIREQVSEDEIQAAMQNEPIAKLTISTRRSVVYKTDSDGNATSTVDYVLESVTKIFRYYSLSNGRVLCTIENIDAEGVSQGESGSFYMLTSRVEQLLSSVLDLKDGIAIDATQRQ